VLKKENEKLQDELSQLKERELIDKSKIDKYEDAIENLTERLEKLLTL